MKSAVFGAVLLAALGSVGCAGTAPAGPSVVRAERQSSIDFVKVVSINKWAHDKGYGVEWVNLPQKSKYSRDDS